MVRDPDDARARAPITTRHRPAGHRATVLRAERSGAASVAKQAEEMREQMRQLGLAVGLVLGVLSCDGSQSELPIARERPSLMLRISPRRSVAVDGVGYVDCPFGTSISGGGCDCTGAGNLFASYPFPSSDSFFCACHKPTLPGKPEAVDMYALCFSGDAEGASITISSTESRRALNEQELRSLRARRESAAGAGVSQ